MRLRVLATIAALPFLLSAADAPEDIITPDAVRAHVEFLASDELEGRETGMRGHEVAARYVAAQFGGLGLKPGAGEGGWFQRVPFSAAMPDIAKSGLTIAGQRFANRKDVVVGPARSAGQETIEAAVVFAGYGIDDPKSGRNDYKGLNVKGKFVAVLSGFPKGMASDQGAHYGRTKALMAQKYGAIGVLTIRTKDRERVRPWPREIEGPVHSSLNWVGKDGLAHSETPNIKTGAMLGDAAAAALFAGAPVPLATLLDAADKAGGRPKGFALKQTVAIDRVTTTGSITSPNVIGVLPGSDPALANEYVLLMAHLDHIGIDPGKTGDQISNGALDNASGTAAMIEAARALAKSPNRPRRSVIFAAVTAEERGLLGAEYLSENSVLPAGGKLVGVVNLDMPILLYDFVDVVAFGAEHSTMGPMVARAGQKIGVALSPDPMPAEGLFTRSDHYPFVKKGVPAVFLMTGFQNGGEKQFRDFLKTHYHKVSDQLDLPFDWTAATKFARLNTLIATELANADEAPKWYADSFFGGVFAKDQAKAVRGK